MEKTREVIKLLMVDDEAILYHGVKRVLENHVVHVAEVDTEVVLEQSWVGTGEECLELLKTSSPDLIFLDYKLPGMSGLDVLSAIREQQKEPLVIMVTAFASLETAVRATKLGAFDFMSKPFTPDEIRYVTRKAVSHLILSRKAKSAAEEKKRIRFEFLSILAHELKAPINAIEGYLDLLKDRTTDNDRLMVDRSLIRLDAMRKLIFDLLDLTRIESGQKQREQISVDFMKVLRATVELLEADAAARRVTIQLPQNPELLITADPGEMEIIANNLLSNAIKYNREGGRVTVRAVQHDENLLFEVQDTGIGMTAVETAKLFQDFMRIRNEKTVSILGSGLGLSTVRKLARLYGGDATVVSVPGEGSTFSVHLCKVFTL